MNDNRSARNARIDAAGPQYTALAVAIKLALYGPLDPLVQHMRIRQRRAQALRERLEQRA